MKDKLLKIVSESTGIKGVDLAVALVMEHGPANAMEMFQALKDLVENGDIIEIEYVVPHMNYRAKSIYFPKGTELMVIKK